MRTTNDNCSTTFIQIAKGKTFDFLNPDLSNIEVEDLVVSLAKQNRYTGYTKYPYSVAQHSVLMSENCEEIYAYPCLMHDLHEGLISDMAKPLKDLLPGFKKMEEKIEKLVHKRFNLVIPEKVYWYDIRLLMDEKKQLMEKCEKSWNILNKPLGVKITEWSWKEAYFRFMERYEELKPE